MSALRRILGPATRPAVTAALPGEVIVVLAIDGSDLPSLVDYVTVEGAIVEVEDWAGVVLLEVQDSAVIAETAEDVTLAFAA